MSMAQPQSPFASRTLALRRRLDGHPLAQTGAARGPDGEQLWPPDTEPPADYRGDSNWVWQARGFESQAEFESALHSAHSAVVDRDSRGFLKLLSEDGAHGAQCTQSADGLLSRDLLDSANELCFLDEALSISLWDDGVIVDVGAGYGRFAHRVASALPRLRVICTDGVAGSLALAEAHLAHHAVPAARARVVPPDELELALVAGPPKLAVAIHSFPEMEAVVVARWLALLARVGTEHLFVVSNVPSLEGEDATPSLQSDEGADLLPAFAEAGFRLRLARPKFPTSRSRAAAADAAIAPAYGECTHFLFQRAAQQVPRPPAAPCGACYVINLPRRTDRRAWMQATAAASLSEIGAEVTVTDATDGSHGELRGWRAWPGWELDEPALSVLRERWAAQGLTAVAGDELLLYHGRPVSSAEMGCLASHRQAWAAAEAAGLAWALFLEDDVTACCSAQRQVDREHRRQWARLWHTLVQETSRLAASGDEWHVLYLGRHRLAPDVGAVGERLVEPGFSSCAHAYALSARGLRALLALPLASAALPTDELLPALYAPHPRADVDCWSLEQLAVLKRRGYLPPSGFRALAFRDDLVWQMESFATGSADEVHCLPAPEAVGPGGAGEQRWSLHAADLCRSDVRPPDHMRPRRPGPPVALAYHARAAQLAPSPGIFADDWPHPDWASLPVSVERGEAVRARWWALPRWSWLFVGAAAGPEAVVSLGRTCRGLHHLLREPQLWRSFLLRWAHSVALGSGTQGQRQKCASDVEATIDFGGSWARSCVNMLGGRGCAAVAETGDARVAGASVVTPASAAQRAKGVTSDAGSEACSEVVALLSARAGSPRMPACLSVASLTPRQFARRAESEPLVLRCALSDLVAEPERWTVPGLLQLFAQRSFPCVDQSAVDGPARCRMRLLDYVRYMHVQQQARPTQLPGTERTAPPGPPPRTRQGRGGADVDPLVLFESRLPPELLRALAPPALVELADVLDAAVERQAAEAAASHSEDGGGVAGHGGDGAGSLLCERRWLVVGPAGAGSRWHQDPFETAAWNVLLSGRKLWCLMPPAGDSMPPDVVWRDGAGGCGDVSAPPSRDWFDRHLRREPTSPPRAFLWWLQSAGEIVWVPRGWWHSTLNLEETVAFTQNVVTRPSAAAVLDALAVAPGQGEARRALQEAVRREL